LNSCTEKVKAEVTEKVKAEVTKKVKAEVTKKVKAEVSILESEVEQEEGKNKHHP